MKKLQVLFMALSLAVITAACQRGKHVTIKTTDEHNVLKIEYAGRIVFAENNKSVISLSPNGYLKFSKNDETLDIENNRDGHIVYQVNGGQQSTKLNEGGQQLLNEAVKQITKVQGKRG